MGLGLPDAYCDGLRSELIARRDQLSEGLSDLGFGVHRSQGTYFVLTDVRPLGWDDGITFCRDLPPARRCRRDPLPGVRRGPDSRPAPVRWAFCQQEAVLDEALDRLSRLPPR